MEQDDVVVKRRDQIRIFLNDHGGISIVQECWPDKDAIVAFELEDAEVIAQAILDIYKEGWSC